MLVLFSFLRNLEDSLLPHTCLSFIICLDNVLRTTRDIMKDNCFKLAKERSRRYPRMLRAILNKSRRQHPTKKQLYGHLPFITKTIKVRRTRHAGHRWRSKDELISNILRWTLSQGRAKTGRPARTYIQQLCADKTSREQWTIKTGGERGPGRSLLAAQHDIYIYVYIYIWPIEILRYIINCYFNKSSCKDRD